MGTQAHAQTQAPALPTSLTDKSLAATSSAKTSDLCPDIANIKNATDNNLNNVQADIDRLGLCVERAKLLQQLDELVTKRQALLTGEEGAGLALPPLPMAGNAPTMQLKPTAPTLDNKTVANTLNRATPPAAKAPTPATPAAAAPTPPPAMPEPATLNSNAGTKDWAIQRIWGQPPHIQAQIIAKDATIATVTVGEPLPDGYAVESISARGVILSRAGKMINLDWENTSTTPDKTENIIHAQPTLAQ